jgi:DNA-binding response OmpR family regulator
LASTPIVFVTDDDHLRDEVTGAFPAEFTLHLAKDSREATAMMGSLTPAAVVADIRTGSAGAVGLARDMAQNAKLAMVPILMLLERPQDEWLARVAGAQLVRTRPVSIERLVLDVRSLVSPTASN